MHYDLWRIAGVLLVASITGLAAGQLVLCLLIGVLGYVIWQHRNLYRLRNWLRHSKRYTVPDIPGVYEEVCREIDRLRTGHKKRKKKLSDYLKQFREATTASPDATVVLGCLDDIRWANAAATRLLGVYWPQDGHQRITNLVRHPRLAGFLRQEMDKTDTLEITSPTQANVELSIRVVPYGNNQRLLIARDVTRLHRLNEMRRDLVANVSHELRTPLTVIRGYLDAMDPSEEDCPDAWKISLQEMDAQTTRMQNLIDDLLLLSKLEQEETVSDPDVVAVPEMLATIHKEAQALSGEHRHVFELSAQRGLWLLGKQTELYSAFCNLVSNAVSYTPANGVIRIRWYHDEQGAHMAVTDTGIGIAEHHLARLTERFYRVDTSRSRDTGGTGLGLAIVKHVLNRHNAKLHIESDLSKGSTFRCDFPPEAVVLENGEEGGQADPYENVR